MQYSTQNKLKLMEGTDNVKRQDFVDNFNIIDNGLSKFYVATLSSTNTYKVTTGNSLSSLSNGYSIRVAIPSDSTGAVSVIVDAVTVPVKKPNGNAVTNFKANGVYSLTYYNSVFILASGGIDDVSFTSDKLLTGYSANDSNGEKVEGTMPDRGAYQTANGVGSGTDYISLNKIPEGYYHSNSDNSSWAPEVRIGKSILASHLGITADKIKSGQTICGVTGSFTNDANATASQILSGYSAYVKGNKVTGNMTNRGAVSATLNAGGSYTIPAGYHNGSGKVTANSASSQGLFTTKSGTFSITYTGSSDTDGATMSFTISGIGFTPKIMIIRGSVQYSGRTSNSSFSTYINPSYSSIFHYVDHDNSNYVYDSISASHPCDTGNNNKSGMRFINNKYTTYGNGTFSSSAWFCSVTKNAVYNFEYLAIG